MHYLIKVDYVCGNNSHLIKVNFFKTIKNLSWQHLQVAA
jgi:hypothetical protein